MKLLFLMPVYSTIQQEAFTSFAIMTQEIHDRGDDYLLCMTGATNTALARNLLFKTAAGYVDKVDYIVCLDMDHRYSAQTIYTLIGKLKHNNLELLAASYRVRQVPPNTADIELSMVVSDNGVLGKIKEQKALELAKDHPDGLVECEVAAMGCMVIKPTLIREMTSKYASLFEMDALTYMGEDVFFCKLLKKEGKKLYFDALTRIPHLTTICW